MGGTGEGGQGTVPPITVGLAYVGSVLGIGLVSGAEVAAAFVNKGEGWASFLVTGIILSLGGAVVVAGAARWRTGSYREFLLRAAGGRLGRFLDLGVSVYLVAGLATGLAGGGELLGRWLELPPKVLSGVLVAIFLALLGLDLSVFMGVSRLVVPVVFAAMGAVALSAGKHGDPGPFIGEPKLFISALLYGFFNVLAGMVVLTAMGKRMVGGGVWVGAATGGALLTAVLFIVERAVRGETLPLPLLQAAGRVNPNAGVVYGFLLGLALLTSIGGGIYGLGARFGAHGRFAGAGTLIMIAFLLSLAGLSAIVQYLYLMAGGLGAVIVAAAAIRWWLEVQGFGRV